MIHFPGRVGAVGYDDMWQAVTDFVNQYFGLFPIGSLFIFLVFAALGLWNYRIAWFLSLSAPGAFVLPMLCIELSVDLHPVEAFRGILLSIVPFPGLWAFTIVFAFQIRNLVKKKRDKMTPYSFIWVAVLLGLYWGTNLVGQAMLENKFR